MAGGDATENDDFQREKHRVQGTIFYEANHRFSKGTIRPKMAIFKGRKWVCYGAKIFKSTTCLANDGKHSLILSRKICKSTNDRFQKLT